MTELSLKIIREIKKIPRGRTASYREIAKRAGSPGAARRVAWILHSCSRSHKLPWHQVIGSNGKISFPRLSAQYTKQRRLLKAEGVTL